MTTARPAGEDAFPVLEGSDEAAVGLDTCTLAMDVGVGG